MNWNYKLIPYKEKQSFVGNYLINEEANEKHVNDFFRSCQRNEMIKIE